MRSHGPHRALRHIASALARLGGSGWPLAPVPPVAAGPEAPTCPGCKGDRICPVTWETLDDDHWRVLARCGDCEAWTELVIANAQAAALDTALSHQIDQIRRAADRLDSERMAAQADAFAAALQRDLIVATDF
jgi:hypothetical protein